MMVCHAPEMYRVINGETANCEVEERSFTYLKRNAKLNTNHHTNNVVDSLFLRWQCREEDGIKYNPTSAVAKTARFVQ